MDMTSQQLSDHLQKDSDIQIVDVREADEVASGMIAGAKHIPLGELPARLGELDKSRRVVAVCRSGRRSEAAAEQLAAAGFTSFTMTGGMLDWTAAGLPTGSPLTGVPGHRSQF